jgi:GNAT superfamily N-acetyltransferase
MRLWAAYEKEKYGRDYIEYREGGVTYGIILYKMYNDRSCLISTLFVEDGFRNQGIGKSLEASLLEKENPRSLHCTIDKESDGWQIILTQFINNGYEFDESSKSDQYIPLYKEMKHDVKRTESIESSSIEEEEREGTSIGRSNNLKRRGRGC